MVCGDSVAILMENRPEYVGMWLGCTKLGVVTALINTNLRGVFVCNSISSSMYFVFIYGTELVKIYLMKFYVE